MSDRAESWLYDPRTDGQLETALNAAAGQARALVAECKAQLASEEDAKQAARDLEPKHD